MSFPRSEFEPFRCDVERDREAVRVAPVGELDLATVPLVEEQLNDLWSVGFKRLVLDLRGVRFLDSTGVRMLMAWHARDRADGVAFGVIPGPPAVQRVLEICGVGDWLQYVQGGRNRDAR
jgi:anti-sigma B factor antagonist